MPRKPPKPKAKPSFDAAPLDDDEEEGACPIPDEDGNIVLRRSRKTTKGAKRGKGKDKPAR